MIIKAIKIEPETAIKIFEKHNVLQEEIYDVIEMLRISRTQKISKKFFRVLKNDKPKFKKAGGDQYIAIGLSRNRYLTIFFRLDGNEAEITTAYPSNKGQIKSYKKMK